MYDIIKYVIGNIGFLFLMVVFVLSLSNSIDEVVHRWRVKHGTR